MRHEERARRFFFVKTKENVSSEETDSQKTALPPEVVEKVDSPIVESEIPVTELLASSQPTEEKSKKKSSFTKTSKE